MRGNRELELIVLVGNECEVILQVCCRTPLLYLLIMILLMGDRSTARLPVYIRTPHVYRINYQYPTAEEKMNTLNDDRIHKNPGY